MASPYKSIEDKVNLPKKHNIAQYSKIFKPIEQDQKEPYKLNDSLLSKANGLVQELNKSFEIFDNPGDYRFKFPESLFPPVAAGQRNNIRYEQKMISEQENTFKDRLSEEQLREIQETGEFKVKSNIDYITLPYVWRINPALFWGKKKIKQVWNKSMATIFGFFWTAKKFMEIQIPIQLKSLSEYPKKFADLLVGLKSIKTVISVDYQRQIFKDFWKAILNENYHKSDQWCSALWEYLYVYNNPQIYRPIEPSNDRAITSKRNRQKQQLHQQFQAAKNAVENKKADIIQIDTKFNVEWGKLRKKVIIDVTAEVNNAKNDSKLAGEAEEQALLQVQSPENKNDQKILQKLTQRKFTLYIEHMKTQLPNKSVPLDVINAIVFILRLFNSINLKVAKKQKLKSKKLQQVREKVKNLYKIKSLFPPFFNYMVDLEIKPIYNTLDEEVNEQIFKDNNITYILRNDQKQAIKQYIKLRLNHDALIEAKRKSLPLYHGPTRVFYSNYHLLPPYKVLQDQNKYYSLKKISDDLTIDTSTNFWKLKLYWMRFKTWTINCLVFLAFSAWKGPVGLRCLWGVADFNYQMNIHYQTGQIYYETRSTVIGTFNRVLDGIQKSRRAFEETPDLGLLGKNISRYANYLECYVFRFLFVGVFLTLICYPLLIIVASTLTIVLVATFWAWIPLIMAVCYLFNIIFKQFETSYIDYGFWSRSFPIIKLVFGILKCLFIILFSVINLIVVAPILTFFFFIFSSIQRGFRTTVDCILLFAFRRVGRTPSRDTNIAKKISGPGMTKYFYMSINEQDVYVLVQARLELIYLQQFDRIVREKIQQNSNRFTNTIVKVLKPFNTTYYGSSLVLENTNNLNSNYSKQYTQYRNRYPANPYNVRFTQEQIDNYFDNTINIVRRFVDKHEIRGWIFEKYQLYEGMYDELTRAVWMDIFGCGEEIFEPLEKLDSRFKLEDQYHDSQEINFEMRKKVGSVMKALEGEVKLSHQHKKLTPFKHNLLNRQRSIEQIHEIFSYLAQNSIHNVKTHLNDVKIVFVPNLNIKEIIAIEEEARIQRIKDEKFIIDL